MVRRIDTADLDTVAGVASHRELQSRSAASAPTESAATSPADAWLGVFTRLLRLPEPQRQSIRTELEAHIHERSRDLMLEGCDERAATRRAIDELGEIAQLARRFEAADRPHPRRLLMHLSIITVIATAAVTGAVVLKSSSSTPQRAAMRTFEGQGGQPSESLRLTYQFEPPADVGSITVSLQPDMTMESLVELILKDARLGVSIDWEQMELIGLSRETPLGIGGSEMPLETVLSLIAARGSGPSEQLAWRFRDRMLLLATAERFDLDESVLSSYSVADVLMRISSQGDVSRIEAADQLADLITQFVEPESWVGNGGSLAKLQVVGGKMFVEAPPRIQERVQWIVSELAAEPDAGAGDQARSGSDQSPTVLGDIPLLHSLFHDAYGRPVRIEGTIEGTAR